MYIPIAKLPDLFLILGSAESCQKNHTKRTIMKSHVLILNHKIFFMKKTLLSFFACIFLIASSYGADVLTLTNQKTFAGQVVSIKNCMVEFQVEESSYLIPTNDVLTLEFEDPQNPIYQNFLVQSDGYFEKCMSGKMDAENFHGKTGGHFVLGVLFGPFAMIGTALSNPTPYKGKTTYMMSKNKDLFQDPAYLSCYKKEAKKSLIKSEALGWLSWVLLVLVL